MAGSAIATIDLGYDDGDSSRHALERTATLVVGAEDHGLVERLLGGDVGQRVARKAPCDVLIVRPSSDDG